MSGQLVQWKSSPDRVIQNTPTRTSHSPSHSPSIESDMNEMNVSYDTPEIQAATTNSIEGSPQSNPNPVKFMNANDIFQKPLRLLDESPQHDEELNIEVGDGDRPNTNILRNERTPDLDRISNFFKNNRTPGKENLLTKYESSGLEDTPLSSRKKLTFHNSNNLLEPQISERLKSNTEFCSYKESNDGENNTSLEVTEADATFLQAAELSADNYNCLAEEATTRKKYKADSSLTESIQDRDVQKTEIVASAESPNSIISSLGKNGTSKDGWTMRRISEAFENNEDEIKIFGEGGAMRSNSEYHSTNDSKEESSQIIRGSELKAENNEMGKNLNVSSQKNMNNSYTNIEKSATCGTPSNNNVVQETPFIDSRSNRTPSKRWVFRYSRDETEFNSNRSTQIVNNPRTQEMALDNFPINTQSLSKSYNIDTNNELETQIIVSSLSQGISAQKGPDFQSTGQTEEIKTQIINSPEHNTLNVTLQTPGNISRISFEPILEVPETSSPSKNALSKPSNSSPIPKEKDAFNVYEKEIETNNVFSNDMQRSLNADSGDHAMLDGSSDFYEQKEIADRVFLQLSGKQKSDLGNDKAEFPSQNELDVKREGTIMSEAELTQELPEVEEQQGLDTSPKTLAKEKLVTTERPKGKETSLQIDADNTDCNPDEQDDAELPPKTFTGQEAGEKNSQFQKKSIRLFQNESQEIVQNRRTIKRRQKDTIEIGEEEENRSTKTSPSKRLKRSTDSEPTSVKREGSSSISLQAGIEEGDEDFRKKTYAFPEGIRVEDSSFLSKDDITNGNAVWCQYSWNYKFYPGILLDIDTNQDSCWIYFESGKSLTKEEDIYYLDIRIGDAVIFDGNEYIVVGLECRSHDPNIIRCIRGYDTVYMKKKNLSGSLGKRTLIKALSSISLDLNEWTKRAKIIMEDNERTKGNAYRYLRHPIRGRKSMTNVLSPKKLTDDEKGMRKHTRMHINDQELRCDNKETIKKSIKDLSSSLGGSPSQLFSSGEIKKGNIFDGCIFVLTSLFENREELHQVIESQGGTVIESGFSVLFDFPHPPSKSLLIKSSPKNIHELDLKLAWKPDCLFTDYRFACLITKRHLRSLKYLETLALGWPTLHWKFISACIEEKRILPRLIHQYLLPSGESFRLSSDSQSKGGIIKSNNIFSFYTKFLQGSNLKDQMHKVKNMLNDYIIIKCGSSELDSFIKFAFACLGANRMFEIDLPSIEVENTEPLLNILGPLILQIGSTLSDENLKFLIYVNESNGKSQMRLLEKLRSQLSVNFDHLEYIFHTESKEWLIQTIINENTGFRDTVRDDDRCDTIPDADYTDRNI
ncbi:Rad9p [Saccharomyces cerevisiae x Saccharomyces kudriavzevii VIN7]|uniref:Rad9p n=1 Tax=Saccharomyces cerevisiae x Saccharomyces kudriavzevii (strain VIN7) TaxID=1095631 RepID=H0GSY0_SACCK|nr:Rad9p [Saccharomyces cerevisiae x Saccharomyces kudriavzevii VIN7]